MSTQYRGLGDIIVTARPYDEYVAMFALRDEDILAGPVLDCPAGACGFVAGARARGARAMAVDPEYAAPHDDLVDRARVDTAYGNTYVREHADNCAWTFFRDPDDHLQRRMAAVDAFDADRRAHPDDYVAATLPALPFDDGAFHLVLSSHLLFVYPDHFDYDQHLAFTRELARVASGEARIFPLVDTTAARWPHLDRLRDDLSAHGVQSHVVPVDYEFIRSGVEMLVLRPS